MLNASLIRERAREFLVENYWLAVVVTLVGGILLGASGFTAVGSIILLGPISVGLCIFFLGLTRKQPVKFETMFSGFSNFVNTFVLGLLSTIFITLWTLLLFIPGIIKSYSYSMCYYIMADNPDISANLAITKSREIMDGFKWRLFCLDFSFIGWILLSCITCGIGLIFLAPYMQAAHAVFYEEIKENLQF